MNLKKILLLGGVGLGSAAAGIAIPQLMQGKSQHPEPAAETAGHDAPAEKPKKDKKPKADDHGHGSGGHDAGGHGSGGHGAEGDAKDAAPVEGPCFIPFGRMVVNLNDPTLTRYLSLEVTIQADGPDQDTVTEALESRKPILQTWLTGHLADKTLEDVRGKVGVNRLRREIQDNFNALLFTDGHERIQDILFEEFHVQ